MHNDVRVGVLIMRDIKKFWALKNNVDDFVLPLFESIYSGISKTTKVKLDNYKSIEAVIDATDECKEKSVVLLWMKLYGKEILKNIIKNVSRVTDTEDNREIVNYLNDRIAVHLNGGYIEFVDSEVIGVLQDLDKYILSLSRDCCNYDGTWKGSLNLVKTDWVKAVALPQSVFFCLNLL